MYIFRPLDDASKLAGSKQHSPQFSDVKQRKEQTLGTSDVNKDSMQNRDGSSDGIVRGDIRKKSHFSKEEQVRADSKAQFNQTIHGRKNGSTGYNIKRNEHTNTRFTGSKANGFRSSNSVSEEHTGAVEAKRAIVNEGQHVGRQVERCGNTSLPSGDAAAPKV
jgi:hypothetical protein